MNCDRVPGVGLCVAYVVLFGLNQVAVLLAETKKLLSVQGDMCVDGSFCFDLIVSAIGVDEGRISRLVG